MSIATYHIPVLAGAVAALAAGVRRAVDATVGGGGHAALLLEAGAEVLAADRDPEAIAAARARLPEGRVRFHLGRLGAPDLLATVRQFRPDLILLDLGVSSRQLDEDERGFSFRPGVPLDMRMTAGTGPDAARVLNTLPDTDLRAIFHDLADEPRARKLAAVIARRRSSKQFRVSDDLVNAIREALGARSGPSDFARLFQAVRMAVNHEVGELNVALPAMLEALEPGGAFAVITYHSGEDRLVKQSFREWASNCICPPRQPVCTCRGRALGRLEPRKPILPGTLEVSDNPRARSAKLRIFRVADAL